MGKYDISSLQRLARSRGGEGARCLSDQYLGVHTKLRWLCAKHGEFMMTPNNVIHKNSWCLECYDERRASSQFGYSISDMQKLAHDRGGPGSKCLSKVYLGAHADLEWLCTKHGQFSMRPNNIRNGSWCRRCSYEKRASNYPHRLALEDAKKIALDRGGNCLEKTYKNSSTKMRWQCADGHIWTASLTTVKRGHWCEECQRGQGEQITREILERLFGDIFPKCRPDWLRNPKTRFPLELDGYSPTLQIAFEYQGAYHHAPMTHLKHGKKQLKNVKFRDQIKKDVTKSKGIKLLLINEVSHFRNLEELKKNIGNELKREFIPFSEKRLEAIQLQEIKFFSSPRDRFLAKLTKVVGGHRGRILTKHPRREIACKFECSEGHKFPSMPNNILSGTWCTTCALGKNADRKRLSTEHVRTQSLERGFRFLSPTYANARTKYEFECLKCGHIRACTFDNINSGNGCPKCKRNMKYSIQTCQEAASIKGGRCLSKLYQGARTALWWQCGNGHLKWKAAPSSIINQRSWCPTCWNLRRAILYRKTGAGEDYPSEAS